GHVTVAEDTPPACSTCGSADLKQDEDVLDTWFSSALWPFSTLGWPEQTEDLAYFYPTTVLVTGYDILFFWVARMMMMGIEFMGEPPFGTVLLHGLVRDAQGRKMSKSRGNTVDPLAVIDQFGADALRWALTVGTAPGNDVRMSQDKIEGARNFANKLWNAARFVLMQVDRYGTEAGPQPLGSAERPADLGPADRWILTRLQETIADVDRLLEKYELSEASHMLHEFIWGEFCDWYIELVKPSLQAGGDGARAAVWTLVTVLDGCLRLLHPIMPFITEEIWQRLPNRTGLLALASWPQARDDLTFDREAQVVELARSVIRALRGLRSDLNVEPGKAIAVVLAAGDQVRGDLEQVSPLIAHLAGAGEITFRPADGQPPHPAVASVVGPVSVYVPAAGVFDVDKEIARLKKELATVEERGARLAARLADERFTARAPADVVAKERERLAENESRQARLRELLQQLT